MHSISFSFIGNDPLLFILFVGQTTLAFLCDHAVAKHFLITATPAAEATRRERLLHKTCAHMQVGLVGGDLLVVCDGFETFR